MDWQLNQELVKEISLGGGATTHYKGSGYEAEFFSAYSDINEFAKSNGPNGSE